MNDELTQPAQQEQKALISLIIPIYNVEGYIAECLESAIKQSFPHLEIICVDDCGTDGTMDIVQQYAEQDKRITIIRNPHNLGLAGSRNVGIDNSSAPYIMFLDSDDTFALDMCEKMYHALHSSGADLAACGTQVSYETNFDTQAGDEEYYRLKYVGLQKVTDELVTRTDVSACNKIHRRDFIDRYGIRFPAGLHYEDSYFFHACMGHAESIMFVNEKLYHYRRREGSIMNKTFAKNSSIGTDHLKIALVLHDYYRTWNLLEKKQTMFWQFFMWCFDFAYWHSPSPNVQGDVLKMAADFATANAAGTLPPELTTKMMQIKQFYPKQVRNAFLRVKVKLGSFRYSFLGIPLYTVKYTNTASKHYILGLQVLRKKYA